MTRRDLGAFRISALAITWSLASHSPAAELGGLWEFDNPANLGEATVGSDLTVGGTHTHHANLADDGGGTLNGAITTMGNTTASFFTATHNIGANGGGTFVNEYTLLVDLFTPAASRGTWRAIFQTTGSPSGNDADYWIRPDNDHLGVGAIGYSDAPIDETAWTRLVITVDLNSAVTTYLDGAHFFTHSASDGVDGRHSLFPVGPVHFLADDPYRFSNQPDDGLTPPVIRDPQKKKPKDKKKPKR
jgi:hypothetical protein